ncbi:hypothetical protein [Natronococcus pandeyae]|uniref:hypothetical protein n=1 Tax=Natronococcus pandeyae TaxID=2055836 RepID=UPI0011E74531|nr:hypothetical protein [Natronococcus pandeyae]
MSGNSNGPTRRSILKTSAVIGGYALLTTSGSADELEATPSDYSTLRGSVDEPITDGMIQDVRTDFVSSVATSDRGKSREAYLNLEAFKDDEVYGYNIFTDSRENIREQFVVVGSGMDSQPSASTSDPNRLTEKADEYLEDAAVESISSNDVSAQDWDIDWTDWDSVANDTVHWEAERTGSDYTSDARPGKVIFQNRVRSNWDDERIAARTGVRLEAGREHCLDGNDEYCKDDNSVHTGWRNKEAHIYHDWNQGGNSEGDVTGLDPSGNTSEGSRTRRPKSV